MPVCTKCGETKGPKAFNKNKFSPNGLHSYCKLCRRQAASDLNLSVIEEYGVTYTKYLALAKNPEDKCPTCKMPNLITHPRGFRICGWCKTILRIVAKPVTNQ